MEKEKEPREYAFTAWGHPNIRATHPTTLMFTKDPECTAKGDCIVGVRADFDVGKVKEFLRGVVKPIGLRMRIAEKGKEQVEELVALINPDFNDGQEMVVRKSDFKGHRTLAIRATKASLQLSRKLVSSIKKNDVKMVITLFLFQE